MEGSLPWQETVNLTAQVSSIVFMIRMRFIIFDLGWSAQFCTYVLQALETKKIIGLWVASTSMVCYFDNVYIEI